MRYGICTTLTLTALVLLALAGPSLAKPPAPPPDYGLLENATLVTPGDGSPTAARTSSTGNPFSWGAVNLPITPRLKLRQLTYLSTAYQFVDSSCWGGSPRFEAWVNNGGPSRKIFFYIGPAPNYTGCAEGAYANSGNLALPTSPVDASQIGGSVADSYGSVQAKYGGYTVTAVYIDVDGGWLGDQTVDFDNSQVNRQIVTYEG